MKLILLFTLLSFFGMTQQICPVIPTPTTYKTIEGELLIAEGVSIDESKIPDNILEFLRTELKVGFEIPITKGMPEIIFQKMKNVPQDFYSINVNKNIRIGYSSEQSQFYAVNSLIQLIQGGEDNWHVQKLSISDAPKFQWRGLHLDVSRHFFSVNEIKKFIDNMALYKFNKFHWHLTDDQGWRIEVKKYPKLTEIGAFRDSTVIGHYSRSPREYEKKIYGGFYSQDEVKEVVAYAASKYITVVPEIEMPGHSRAALAAYPELSCNGEKQEVPGLWGIFDDIYCSKEESIEFMQDVLDEVLELFPSEHIHIGGDEAPKTRWKSCPNCQRVIKENGLKDEHELQSYFIKRMDKYLSDKNRKLIGWDEILEGGLSPNAAVMSWRGDKRGKEAASQGHYVVMSPNTHCYFDYYQSSHSDEPLAIGGYLPLEKVYDFSPIPEGMNDEVANYILGGQANLWTEYMPSMDHVEYMTYPRALALIQSLWCQRKPSYNDFLSIYLAKHQEYLKAHGVNFSNSIHFPKLNIERGNDGLNVSFKGAYKDSKFEVSQATPNDKVVFEKRVVQGDDKIFISKGTSGDVEELHLSVKSIGSGVEASYKFNLTDLLGADVELITPAHPKFNNNGSLNLVDGIKGRSPWKGSEWLGFREDTVAFIVDLEFKRKINGLQIGYLEENGSWIYLPETIQLEKSKDGVKWKKISRKALKEVDVENGRFKVPYKTKTKFLKVTTISMNVIPDSLDGGGHAPWTFIDEIEVY